MNIKTLKLVDTHDFMRWAMNKYGMTNEEWHDKIWHGDGEDYKGLCDHILDSGSYVTFNRAENPDNLFEEHINAFLDDFPELNNKVSFVFTN